MDLPTSSLPTQMPMLEHQKPKVVLFDEEEEEEEMLSLQTRQFQHPKNNTAAHASTDLLLNISSTSGNGNGNGNENGNGSLITSSSINSSIDGEDSETPKIDFGGVSISSPCSTTGSPHKHSHSEDKQSVHNLNSVHFDQHHGADSSIDGVSDMNSGGVTCSVFETTPRDMEVLVNSSKIQKSLIKDVNLQLGENLNNGELSGSSLTPLEDTFEEQNYKSKPSDSETRVVGDSDLIEEIDQEVTELDVEKVLQKQKTHDLYCPNCNSCITRRVILHRRIRKIRKSRRKPKQTNADTILHPESDANSTYSDANSADSSNGPDIANVYSNDSPTPVVDDNNCDREPDVFRCLSCFSFFIPAGNGFKLFGVSSAENENVQDPQKISAGNRNWLSSIFTSHKRKKITEQGNTAADRSQVHGNGMNQDAPSGFTNNVSSLNGSDNSVMPHADRTMVSTGEHPDGSYSKPYLSGAESLNPSITEPLLLNKSPEEIDLKFNSTTGNRIIADQYAPHPSVDFPSVESSSFAQLVNDMRGASREAGLGVVSSLAEQKLTESALPVTREKSGDATENSGGSSMNQSIVDKVHSGELAENVSLRPRHGGVNPPEYSASESLIPEQSEKQTEENLNMAIGNGEPLQNGQASSTKGTSLPSQFYSKGGFINDAALKLHEVGKGAPKFLSQGNSRPDKERVNIEDKAFNAIENKNLGNDVIVTIEREPLKQGDPEIVCIEPVETTGLLNSTNQTNIGDQRGAGVGESKRWEILKSIVYGGLIESITSLGVVSSAAGAGSATLNIIALGLANLIGGLFIIGHNLMDLKNNHYNEVNEQEDRYQETLGRRDNFSLHAVVSILSFLIFGLLPPVMYGFSFRRSDDRDLKLAVAGGASLVCIILLAIGKAHIQRKQPKPYLSTVFYFFSIGLLASGASYIAGELINKLLQKISGFESSLPFPELKPTELTAWASY